MNKETAAVNEVVLRATNVAKTYQEGALRTDVTKLKQCLINLLSNAAKFTKGGAITLHVSRRDDDNGTPQEAVATVPFRGHKGDIYEGGIRVAGVIEWPAKISRPRASDVNTVTSDILPTLCDLAGQPLPARPLDGLSLQPLLEGRMTERPRPIGFWNARARPEAAGPRKPYIDPELQKGTTPLPKLGPDGTATRNFQNFHHPDIRP